MSRQSKTALIHYQYDALNRLVSHGLADPRERKRFYCEDRLATEIAAVERWSIIQQGDQVLVQQHQHVGGVASTLLATDLQRTVLSTLQANAQRTMAYSPYGHRTRESVLSNLLGFNGQRVDPVTGHYLLGNGYRAFNPVLKRFNSPDSLSPFESGGLNAYAYCAGDPVNWIDPSGHSFLSVLKSLFKSSSREMPFSTPFQRMRVKPVRKVTKLSDGFIMFEDTYKGKPRLTFQGHGNEDGGYAWWDEKRMINSEQFYNMAKSSGVKFSKYANLRTAFCRSGEAIGGAASFAQGLANLSGVPTKGYIGVIRYTKPTQVLARLKVGEVGKNSYYFGILKNDSTRRLIFDLFDHPYRPVGFEPSVSAGVGRRIRS
ncbi:RHS repeat-associated core domain-containing protein [Pseudomonas sp. YuFO8]|uniref:RHS repeat-associated core domain-containing protein n=1 Tax=Pseudomonas sp. YuFO8 TaxID=3095361 RepID=UPI002B255546|nr:RHS repeat-associated core domain-containing protein [Pseudomonas sp. YuFO8]MEB2621016.1 RHS repeat-associated core domain-containing protein [Pseudomonas sp. YuFO8]